MGQMFGLARIGRDVELRYTQAGDAVASVSLAFNYGKKGADNKRPTQWVDGALWGKRAEALAPYLLKGVMLSVTLDDVHIEAYQGKNGEGHKLAGNITQVELAGGGQQQVQQARQPPQPSAQSQRPPQSRQGQGAHPDIDDDIPF